MVGGSPAGSLTPPVVLCLATPLASMTGQIRMVLPRGTGGLDPAWTVSVNQVKLQTEFPPRALLNPAFPRSDRVVLTRRGIVLASLLVPMQSRKGP